MAFRKVFNVKLIIKFNFRIFKRNFCAICESKLNRKIIKLDVKYWYTPFGIRLFKERERQYMLITPVYYCKKCGYMIDYLNQTKIKILQKESGTLKLPQGKKLIKKYKIDKSED